MCKVCKYIFIVLLLSWLIGFFVFLGFANNIENSDSYYIKNSIVLTGGQNRIKEAIKLLDSDLTSTVFISGVNSQVDKKDILRDDFSKYEQNFILGYDAFDTKGNVKESDNWISENGIDEVRIITSDYHIYRSLVEFNNLLPEVGAVMHSVDNINDELLSHAYNWKMLFGEYNKLIYVFIVHGVF